MRDQAQAELYPWLTLQRYDTFTKPETMSREREKLGHGVEVMHIFSDF